MNVPRVSQTLAVFLMEYTSHLLLEGLLIIYQYTFASHIIHEALTAVVFNTIEALVVCALDRLEAAFLQPTIIRFQ